MKGKTILSRISKPTTAVVGLPLLYIGVILLILHFLLHSTSNMLMIVALILEIVGATAHYWKIKRE